MPTGKEGPWNGQGVAATVLRSILILVALIFAPWGLSVLGTSLGLRVFPGPLLSPWVKGESGSKQPISETPPPDWLEVVYLIHYPDVAEAVQKGALRSGYQHYVLYGRAEGRHGAYATPPAATPPAAPPPSAPPVAPPIVAAATQPAPPPAEPPVAAPPALAPPILPGRKPAPPVTVVSPVAAAAPAKPSSDSAVTVSGIRAASHASFTRIVLEMNGPMAIGKRVQRDPRSLDIELPNAVWQTARQGALLSKALRYRIEGVSGGNSRLLIDSDKAFRLKSLFALPADGSRSHRLVLDLVPVP